MYLFVTPGQSHNNSYALYHIGEVARPSVRDFAQYGNIDQLMEEGTEEAKVYDQFSAPAVGDREGETEGLVFVDGEHSLVSIIIILKLYYDPELIFQNITT